MSQKSPIDLLIEYSMKEVSDGFDLAYVHGIEHVKKNLGDGGISEIYCLGLLHGLCQVMSHDEIKVNLIDVQKPLE